MKYLLVLFSCLTLNSYGQCNNYVITVDDCYINIDCGSSRIQQIPVNGMSAYQYGTLVKLSNGSAYWNGRIRHITNYATIPLLFADIATWQANCLSYDTSGANQDSLYNANASKWLSNGDTIDVITGSTDDQTLSISNDTLTIEDGNFVVLPLSGGGTDDQKIDTLELVGTNLRLSLESDGEATKEVDLSSLQDGTGTDDQVIDTFSINGNTISLSIEGDGEAAKTLTVPSGGADSIFYNGAWLKNGDTLTVVGGGSSDSTFLVAVDDTTLALKIGQAGTPYSPIYLQYPEVGSGADDADFFGLGSTTPPTTINQDKYTLGRIMFGSNTFGTLDGQIKVKQDTAIGRQEIVTIYDDEDRVIGGWYDEGLRVNNIANSTGELNIQLRDTTDDTSHRGIYIQGSPQDGKNFYGLDINLDSDNGSDQIFGYNVTLGNDGVNSPDPHLFNGTFKNDTYDRSYGYKLEGLQGTHLYLYGSFFSGWTATYTHGFGHYADMSSSNGTYNIGAYYRARNGATRNHAIVTNEGTAYFGGSWTSAPTGHVTIKNQSNNADILSCIPFATGTEVFNVTDAGDVTATSYQDGFFYPVTSTDAAAPNNTIYYSSDQSALVYKDAGGTVNTLY